MCFILLFSLYRAKLKAQTASSLLPAAHSSRGEKILEVDGTVTTQPVLEHIGRSTWPGLYIDLFPSGQAP